jgi:hypothetical protein
MIWFLLGSEKSHASSVRGWLSRRLQHSAFNVNSGAGIFLRGIVPRHRIDGNIDKRRHRNDLPNPNMRMESLAARVEETGKSWSKTAADFCAWGECIAGDTRIAPQQ